MGTTVKKSGGGHKRSGHKRSGHKRSGHKRSGHKKHMRSGRRTTFKRRRHYGGYNKSPLGKTLSAHHPVAPIKKNSTLEKKEIPVKE